MGRISDEQLAPVMATIAVADTGISRQELSLLHGLWETSVAHIAHELVHKGWIEQLPGRFVGSSGRRPKLAYPSEAFREVFIAARDTAKVLPDASHRHVYSQTKRALAATEHYRFGGKEFNTLYVTYLGGTALLAQHYNLKTESGWFEGEAGWRALVTVDALWPEA